MKLRKIEWEDLKVSVVKWTQRGDRVHVSLNGLSFVSHTFFLEDGFDASKPEARVAIVLVMRRRLLETTARFKQYIVDGPEADSALPVDLVIKLLKMRDALIIGDTSEAYHQLYSIADPAFQSYGPWQKLEEQAKKL